MRIERHPSSLIARIALVAAVFGSALSIVVTGLFDPFGQRAASADAASRETVAVVLCAVVATQEQRAENLSEAPDLQVEAQIARQAARDLRVTAFELLGYRCGPRSQPTRVVNGD